MELNFIKSGDYYIPDIQLQNPNIRLGKWGLMRKSYLRIAQPFLFSEMVLSETLYPHCAEIEAAAKSRMNIILPQLMKHYGVTEQLKVANQLEWVRQMNACVAQAEEVIKGELIYAIILLSYFLDMSDAEIANVLNMVRRSVAYRRTSTLKLLKNLMGGENR